MAKRAYPEHVTLTLTIPRDVAEWFMGNAPHLAQIIRVELDKAYWSDEDAQQERTNSLEERQAELRILGRHGYRMLRKDGAGSNLQKNRDILKLNAFKLGVSWQLLELAVRKHKRELKNKIAKRREREIERLYFAGYNNTEIALRYGLSVSQVGRKIKEIRKKTGRRA